MKNLQNFKHTDAKDSFFFFDIDKTPFTSEELFNGLYKNFLDMLHISAGELIEIIDELAIPARSWFEYSPFETDFLVKEKGVYTERWEIKGGVHHQVKTYHNVYVDKSSFVSTTQTKVCEHIIKQRYGWLWDIAFKETMPRFKENINKLPENIDAKISDIDHNVLFDNDLTIRDLINFYMDKNYKDSKVTKYGISVYYNNTMNDVDIFLRADSIEPEGRSLYLLLSDIEKKDWSAVCERTTQEQTDKGWRWCKQVETEWFTLPFVEEVKKHFE